MNGTVNVAAITAYDLRYVRIVQLEYTKQSSAHVMTGLCQSGLVAVKFICPADYVAGEMVTIDAVEYTVALSSGDTPSGTLWKEGTCQLALCNTDTNELILLSAMDKVPAHNVDPEAHPDIRSTLVNYGGRITRLENMLVNSVTGNPFLVTFDTLDAVTITGTWNESLARIEF